MPPYGQLRSQLGLPLALPAGRASSEPSEACRARLPGPVGTIPGGES